MRFVCPNADLFELAEPIQPQLRLKARAKAAVPGLAVFGARLSQPQRVAGDADNLRPLAPAAGSRFRALRVGTLALRPCQAQAAKAVFRPAQAKMGGMAIPAVLAPKPASRAAGRWQAGCAPTGFSLNVGI